MRLSARRVRHSSSAARSISVLLMVFPVGPPSLTDPILPRSMGFGVSVKIGAGEMATASSDYPRFDLNGQVVLVTAAARGLGRACALACAHAGADIALGLRDK